ncbi:hypothetical protein [Opitutus sp. GAS368]|uniref:hypothetical protein n=1 Tax=Opitutus sp. GAS368 TaxID=1882749 RepID=UPI00087B5703|nr:hypothetical protein [Opitutus sp. GAS368]SDS08796.1 hypothetical protein SAMN05444173_1850 [Opitutus sp. GAS368]
MPRRDALVAGLLAVLVVVLLWPLARQGVDQHHDGIMLKPALDVLSGQVLFRDTFTQYGALTTYLQAAMLWFQPTLLALRLMTVAAYALALFFLYATWRLILPRPLTVLACGLFALFIPGYEKNWLDQYWMLLPWSSVYALMFQGLGLFALTQIIRDAHAVRWGAILGAACACAFWCRQPVGVIMTGCAGASWLALQWAGWTPVNATRRAIVVATLAGFVAVNVLLLGSVALTGALPEWWYQNFIWPSKWAQGSENVSWGLFVSFFVHPGAGAGLLVLLLALFAPGLLPRAGLVLTPRRQGLYYLVLAGVLAWQHERVLGLLALRDGGWTALLPVVVLGQALLCLGLVFRQTETPKTTEYYLVAALAAQAAGSLLQYYPVPDSWHILWALAPAFGLAVYIFWRSARWSVPVTTLVLTAAFVPSLWAKIQSARQSLARPLVTLEHPAVLRGIQVTAVQAQSFHRITAVLEQIERHQPGIPSALIGNDALFLCFTKNRTNPTPYYVTWIGLADQPMNQKRWNYIQSVRPLMFLHKARWEAVNDFYRRARYLPVLYVEDEALEIAVPQELADAMGLKVYGGEAGGGPAKEKPKP